MAYQIPHSHYLSNPGSQPAQAWYGESPGSTQTSYQASAPQLASFPQPMSIPSPSPIACNPANSPLNIPPSGSPSVAASQTPAGERSTVPVKITRQPKTPAARKRATTLTGKDLTNVTGYWNRCTKNGRTHEDLLYEWILDPVFWDRWSGGRGTRKSQMYSEFNDRCARAGFDKGRDGSQIEGKITRIKDAYELALKFKNNTGAGMLEGETKGGFTLPQHLEKRCKNFYRLHEAVKTRISFNPRAQHSTGDEYDAVLDFLAGVVAGDHIVIEDISHGDRSNASPDQHRGLNVRNRGRSSSLDETGDTDNNSDSAGSPQLGGSFGVLDFTSSLSETAEPSSTAGSSRMRAKSRPAPSPSGSAKRPRTIADPALGKGHKRDLIDLFMHSQDERLAFDKQVHADNMELARGDRNAELKWWSNYEAFEGTLQEYVALVGPRPSLGR